MCLGIGQAECVCADADADAEARAEQAAAAEEEGTVNPEKRQTVPCYACGEPMEPGISWHRDHDARSPAEREIDRQMGIDSAEWDRVAQQADVAARETDRVALEERHWHDD